VGARYYHVLSVGPDLFEEQLLVFDFSRACNASGPPRLCVLSKNPSSFTPLRFRLLDVDRFGHWFLKGREASLDRRGKRLIFGGYKLIDFG